MTHETIKKAIKQSEELAKMRSGETMIPPPNYDVAVTLYEREADGSDAENPFLSFGFRPQDFATNAHMKYQRFGVLRHHQKDGKKYMTAMLVHLYWDGSRDEDSAREIILSNSSVLEYGEWRPTAPSDPLQQDDFWDEKLGDPPNGSWDADDYYEGPEDDSDFVPFSNFARPPYEKMNLGGHDA